MRHSPELLDRVIRQMDNTDPTTARAAFDKARAMLAETGGTFASLLLPPVDAAAPRGRPSPVRRAVPEPTGPYVHDRQAGRFARFHMGKRVVRHTVPPTGSLGRLRVLSDRPAYPHTDTVRRMVMSFETEHELYEPYTQIRSDAEWLATVSECSRKGIKLRMA